MIRITFFLSFAVLIGANEPSQALTDDMYASSQDFARLLRSRLEEFLDINFPTSPPTASTSAPVSTAVSMMPSTAMSQTTILAPLPDLVTIGYALSPDTQIVGFDLYSYLFVPDLNGCIERCNWEDRCQALSWIGASQECQLKTGPQVVWENEVAAFSGTTSVFVAQGDEKPETRPAMCGRAELRIFLDQNIPDSDLTLVTNLSSVSSCHDTCVRRGCTAFSFEPNSGNCQLKTGNITESDLAPMVGILSGVLCPSQPLPENGCLSSGYTSLEDTQLSVETFSGTLAEFSRLRPIASGLACLLACGGILACSGFSFNGLESSCIFYRGEGTFGSSSQAGFLYHHLGTLETQMVPMLL